MKKILVIFFIFFLVLSTAIIKNSTKRTSDEIFTKRENIKDLNKEFEKTKLEHEYLSSAEKLLEYQNLYFDDLLLKKKIEEIKIINHRFEKFEK